MSKPVLINIVGPTAIGKTAIAIRLARYFATEIISSDSRQFYQEMAIGTAVPDTDELQQANHHFIQHKSIFDTYSVGDFERDAIVLLHKLFQQHNIVIMVGGSGLYADAVVQGLDVFPDVTQKVRDDLNELYDKEGISALQEKLKTLDPKHFQKVDTQNPQRMIRALEVCLASGKPYSSFLKKNNTKRFFKTITIGLTADREVVYHRINTRVEIMMTNGLLCEVQELYTNRNLNALQTVGYRELFSFLDGDFSLDEAVEEIKKNTRRFAKRQFTWFNKNKDVKWFDYQTNFNDILAYIHQTI